MSTKPKIEHISAKWTGVYYVTFNFYNGRDIRHMVPSKRDAHRMAREALANTDVYSVVVTHVTDVFRRRGKR